MCTLPCLRRPEKKEKKKRLILVPNLLLQLAHVLRPVLVKKFEYLYEALDAGAKAYILMEEEMRDGLGQSMFFK